MLRALGLPVFAVVVVATACSSPTPTDDCDHFVSVECNKIFQCAETFADQTYGDEAGCETKLRAQFLCDSWSCPSNQTYDGSAVESCVNALDGESCADATQLPPQCQNIGPACR